MRSQTYFEVDSKIVCKRPLEAFEVSSLIGAGIKFFLYQRGQIPLPFERLQSTSDSNNPLNATHKITSNNPADHEQSEHFYASTYPGQAVGSNYEIPENLVGLDRAKFVIGRKRLIQLERRAMHNRVQTFKRESQAKETLEAALQCLRTVFTDCLFKGVSNCGLASVLLMFGSSVYTPKEIIRFELDPSFSVGLNQSISEEKFGQVSTYIRSFYKSLIMSPAFMDFTSKSLPSTYSHICFQTKTELTLEDLQKHTNVIRLENIPVYDYNNTRSSRKLIRVKLTAVPHLTRNEKHSVDSQECNNDNFLFDNNSLCFYQIPLRFKGVKCKNKPLV